MKKVIVELKMRITMLVNEDTEISNVVDELDHHVIDTTGAADILDTEITGYEVVNIK